jgi:NAD(P)-dependent dehydrogenase (short-subunit alcohol dehydrogenase family)
MSEQAPVTLVTGAGGGIGSAISTTLAEAGHRVVVADLDASAAKGVVAALTESGARALAVSMDVRQSASVESGFQQAIGEFGRIDNLVTSAGILRTARFQELTLTDWNDVIDTNVKGRFLASQAMARHLISRGSGGSIVHLSSFTATRIAPGRMHYTTSSACIDMLTLAMTIDLGKYGIRVNTVSTGPVDTPMLGWRAQDPARLEKFLERIPLHRLGQPEDVAAAVRFLLSDKATYIDGATLTLDGGWTTY